MATWGEFCGLRPDLAKAGQCPIIHGDGMYAFIVPGPKQRDLHRDGRGRSSTCSRLILNAAC